MEEDPGVLSYEAIYSGRLLPIFHANRLLLTSTWTRRKIIRNLETVCCDVTVVQPFSTVWCCLNIIVKTLLFLLWGEGRGGVWDVTEYAW